LGSCDNGLAQQDKRRGKGVGRMAASETSGTPMPSQRTCPIRPRLALAGLPARMTWTPCTVSGGGPTVDGAGLVCSAATVGFE